MPYIADEILNRPKLFQIIAKYGKEILHNAVLTGTPTAPDLDLNYTDSTNKLATTAFVHKVASQIKMKDAFIYKGTIGSEDNPNATIHKLPCTKDGSTEKLPYAILYPKETIAAYTNIELKIESAQYLDYTVGNNELHVIYNGATISPSLFVEIGDTDTISHTILLKFDVNNGEELYFWKENEINREIKEITTNLPYGSQIYFTDVSYIVGHNQLHISCNGEILSTNDYTEYGETDTESNSIIIKREIAQNSELYVWTSYLSENEVKIISADVPANTEFFIELNYNKTRNQLHIIYDGMTIPPDKYTEKTTSSISFSFDLYKDKTLYIWRNKKIEEEIIVTEDTIVPERGWTYKVIDPGVYYLDEQTEIGDVFICLEEATFITVETTTYVNQSAKWTIIQNNIDGAVIGPEKVEQDVVYKKGEIVSSAGFHVAMFNGINGRVIKDAGFTISTSVPESAIFTDSQIYVQPNDSKSFLIGASQVSGITTGITNSSIFIESGLVTAPTYSATNKFIGNVSGNLDGIADRALSSVDSNGYSYNIVDTYQTKETALIEHTSMISYLDNNFLHTTSNITQAVTGKKIFLDYTIISSGEIEKAHGLFTPRNINLVSGATGTGIFDGISNTDINVETLTAESLVGTINPDRLPDEWIIHSSLQEEQTISSIIEAETEITISTFTYKVGGNELHLSYNGVIISPSKFTEIGEEGTQSNKVKLSFKLYINDKLYFWKFPEIQRDLFTTQHKILLGEEIVFSNINYIVGKNQLQISYDGILMSPYDYTEIGDVGSTSNKIKLTFELNELTEVYAWTLQEAQYDTFNADITINSELQLNHVIYYPGREELYLSYDGTILDPTYYEEVKIDGQKTSDKIKMKVAISKEKLLYIWRNNYTNYLTGNLSNLIVKGNGQVVTDIYTDGTHTIYAEKGKNIDCFVDLTKDQTIGGNKTFVNIVSGTITRSIGDENGNNIISTYVDKDTFSSAISSVIDSSAVHNVGDETIDGVKTFLKTIDGTAKNANGLAVARTIYLVSGATGYVDFDGTSNVSLAVTGLTASSIIGTISTTNLPTVIDESPVPYFFSTCTEYVESQTEIDISPVQYIVGYNQLHVIYNGASVNPSDFTEIGSSGTISTKIKISYNCNVDDDLYVWANVHNINTLASGAITSVISSGTGNVVGDISVVNGNLIVTKKTISGGGGDTSSCVHIYGDETINGTKTFLKTIVGTVTTAINDENGNEIVSTYVNSNTFSSAFSSCYDSTAVHKVGNETINGTKTFANTILGTIENANKLSTPRTISLNSGAIGSATFDGTSNAIINVTSLDATKINGVVSSASVANKLPATAIGDNDTPVYVDSDGVIRSTGKSFKNYISISGGVISATVSSAILADSATIALNTSSAMYAGITSKVGIQTIGNYNQPIYLSSGVPTAFSGNVGNATTPIYIESGVVKNTNNSFDDYVPKSGGSFTGNVTAITQEQTDSSTKLATTEYVKIAIAKVVDNAPETLDTLRELAEALGEDPNFATTVTTMIGEKATDAVVVHLDGNETISGTKTFTSTISGTIISATNADFATSAGFTSQIGSDNIGDENTLVYVESGIIKSGNSISNYLPLSGGTVTGVISGTITSANQLTTARTISLISGAIGSAAFDGTSDISIEITELDAAKLNGTIPTTNLPHIEITTSGEGNAITVITADDHKVYVSKTETFAVDSSVVHLTNNETISGTKTFENIPMAINSNGSYVRVALMSDVFTVEDSLKEDSIKPVQNQVIYSAVNSKVSLTGDETISGTKTFESRPKVIVGESSVEVSLKTDAVPTDSALNSASTNPVQNKVIYSAVNSKVSLTGDEIISGTKTFTSTISGTIISANQLATARTISLVSGASGSVSFDGTSDVNLEVTKVNALKLDGIIPTSNLPLNIGNLPNNIFTSHYTSEVVSNTEIDLGFDYTVGYNQLAVTYNGAIVDPSRYTEVGTTSSSSSKIKINFNIESDADLYIMTHQHNISVLGQITSVVVSGEGNAVTSITTNSGELIVHKNSTFITEDNEKEEYFTKFTSVVTSNTEINISPVLYKLGKHQIIVSYDGLIIPPINYTEVTSSSISLKFNTESGAELYIWKK